MGYEAVRGVGTLGGQTRASAGAVCAEIARVLGATSAADDGSRRDAWEIVGAPGRIVSVS